MVRGGGTNLVLVVVPPGTNHGTWYLVPGTNHTIKLNFFYKNKSTTMLLITKVPTTTFEHLQAGWKKNHALKAYKFYFS